MSLIAATLFALIISSSALTSCRTEAKPLNQEHIKFRRLPPREFSAALGSSITIECEAGGSPPPNIHWLKNGRRILNNNRLAGSALNQLGFGPAEQLADELNELNELDQQQTQLSSAANSWSALLDSLAPVVDEVNRIALSSTRSRLFIDCASLRDEAVYTCVAENAFARISSHTKLNLIKPVPVAQQAGSSAENELLSGALAEIAALDGLVTAGKPAQELRQEQSNRSDRNDANGQVNSKQQLMSAAVATAVQAAAVADEQEKQKQLGEAAALAAIPQCLSERATRTEPVRIHMWTHNIVEVMRNSVLLFCRSNVKRPSIAPKQSQPGKLSQLLGLKATAQAELSANAVSEGAELAMASDAHQQLASISWTLPDDRQVDASHVGKYEVLDTGDLLIRDLRWSDMGSYVCTVADDQGGSDSISSFVYPAAVKAASSKRSSARRQVIAPQFR